VPHRVEKSSDVGPLLRIEYLAIRPLLALREAHAKAAVVRAVEQLGLPVLVTKGWDASCTHVVASTRAPTAKLMHALLGAKYLVAPSWLEAVAARPTVTAPMPLELNHVPPRPPASDTAPSTADMPIDDGLYAPNAQRLASMKEFAYAMPKSSKVSGAACASAGASSCGHHNHPKFNNATSPCRPASHRCCLCSGTTSAARPV
jgi:hypothetical protein